MGLGAGGEEPHTGSQTWLRSTRSLGPTQRFRVHWSEDQRGRWGFSSLPRDSTGSQGTEALLKWTLPWQVCVYRRQGGEQSGEKFPRIGLGFPTASPSPRPSRPERENAVQMSLPCTQAGSTQPP